VGLAVRFGYTLLAQVGHLPRSEKCENRKFPTIGQKGNCGGPWRQPIGRESGNPNVTWQTVPEEFTVTLTVEQQHQ
jgi:hypothetical protein